MRFARVSSPKRTRGRQMITTPGLAPPPLDAPLVTFIVPCYRLAHCLPECVGSIAGQTYANIETLILDDDSPDDTAAISRGLIAAHPRHRIRYVRNDTNLGNIRTYNRGIQLSAGEYVWILSPDDRLRSSAIVDRYVRLMESRPGVAYAFCPAHLIDERTDRGVYRPSVYRERDQVIHGAEFVKDLIDSRFDLVSPGVLMRKSCYENITTFPEDLPHRGDTYVWVLAAMEREVAYFAEAMVDYRIHAESMMSVMARKNPAGLIADDVAVLWRIRAAAKQRRARSIVNHCEQAIVRRYAMSLIGIPVRGQTIRLPETELEPSLARFLEDAEARAKVRALVLRAYGDRLYWSGRAREAAQAYRDAEKASRGRLTLSRIHGRMKLYLVTGGRGRAMMRRALGRARKIALGGVTRRAGPGASA